jgi:hypothetical protein
MDLGVKDHLIRQMILPQLTFRLEPISRPLRRDKHDQGFDGPAPVTAVSVNLKPNVQRMGLNLRKRGFGAADWARISWHEHTCCISMTHVIPLRANAIANAPQTTLDFHDFLEINKNFKSSDRLHIKHLAGLQGRYKLPRYPHCPQIRWLKWILSPQPDPSRRRPTTLATAQASNHFLWYYVAGSPL